MKNEVDFMVCRGTKLLLVATSLAPILLTLWFVEFSKNWKMQEGLVYLIIAIVLTIACVFVVWVANKNLEIYPVKINAVKTADKEIVGFILVYLLPLINKTSIEVNPAVLVFVGVLFFGVVLTSHSYHFNPLLGLMGFHFYEVETEGGISYILITRKNIRKSKDISSVVQISEYMILEA